MQLPFCCGVSWYLESSGWYVGMHLLFLFRLDVPELIIFQCVLACCQEAVLLATSKRTLSDS